MDDVALFVDVQNIYYTTRQCFSRHFDYNKFWAAATHGRRVVKATAFAIDRGDDKQRQFQNILRAIGFEVKLKPFIQRHDGSAKGDWDVGIALDMMEYAPLADVVVLASGDGDFDLLVAKIRESTPCPSRSMASRTSLRLIDRGRRQIRAHQGRFTVVKRE